MNLFIVFNFDNKTFRWQAVGATIKKKSSVICRLCKLATNACDPDTKVHQTPSLLKSSYTHFIHGHRRNRSLKSLLLKLLCPNMERHPNGITGFNWGLIYIFSNNINGESRGQKHVGSISIIAA